MNVSLKASPRREREAAKTRKTRCTTMKPPSSPRPEFSALRTGVGRMTLRILVRLPKRASVEMADPCQVVAHVWCRAGGWVLPQGWVRAAEPFGNSFHSCPTLIHGALAPVIAEAGSSRHALTCGDLLLDFSSCW